MGYSRYTLLFWKEHNKLGATELISNCFECICTQKMRSLKYVLAHKTWQLRSVTWCSDTDVPRSSNNVALAVFFLLHSYKLPCISKGIHGRFKFIAFLFSNPRGKEPLFQLHRGEGKEVCEPARVARDYGDLSQAQV